MKEVTAPKRQRQPAAAKANPTTVKNEPEPEEKPEAPGPADGQGVSAKSAVVVANAEVTAATLTAQQRHKLWQQYLRSRGIFPARDEPQKQASKPHLKVPTIYAGGGWPEGQ